MQKQQYLTTIQVVSAAKDQQLYLSLLEQLERDFARAGLSMVLPEDCSVALLEQMLVAKISSLLEHDFTAYLQLLYIVDVPEFMLKKAPTSSVLDVAGFTAFLIVQRAWQKVCIRKTL